MGSKALDVWRGRSASRIEDLMHAHEQVGGKAAGRRWRTEQLNWSLVLLLAAEFQRYSRSLHDQAVEYMSTQTAQLNFPLGNTLTLVLTKNRKLDTGNATAQALGEDFGRLGMQFWPALSKGYPTWAAPCQQRLEAMNLARNGIVHANPAKLQKLKDDGYPLTQLETVRKFRASASRLASMMDATVSQHLTQVIGGPRPW